MHIQQNFNQFSKNEKDTRRPGPLMDYKFQSIEHMNFCFMMT